MIFQDNVIKEYLKNVYLICGILIRQNKGIKRILILLNAIDNFPFALAANTPKSCTTMLPGGFFHDISG